MLGIVFYDDGCGLCRGTKKVFKSLDWLKRLRFISLGDERAELYLDDLSEQERWACSHYVALPSRQVYSCAEAMIEAGKQVPVLMLPCFLFSVIPGGRWLAGKIYQVAASLRHEERCRFGPASQQEDD